MKYTNKKESCIPTLNDDNSPAVSHSSSEKDDMLNSFFARCFNHALPPLSLESLPHIEVGVSEIPTDLFCTEEEVCSYLLALDATKACGLDGLTAKCLKGPVWDPHLIKHNY